MNICIVENDIQTRKLIKKICQEYFNNPNINYYLYQNGANQDIFTIHYDLIFLDIELNHELNGIELAMILRNNNKTAPIIIISGYQKYKLEAYKIRPFSYLDKPITKYSVFKELDELKEYNNSYVESINKDSEFVIVKFNGITNKIYLDTIYYFEYTSRKLWITTKQKIFECYNTMTSYAEELKDKGFILVHRNFLVNIKYIKSFNSLSLTMLNNQILPISKLRYKDFKAKYIQYVSQYNGDNYD